METTPTNENFPTREAWLRAACDELVPILQAATHLEIPPLHVSVGFPKGARGRKAAIGQCHHGEQSADGNPHLFISPVLDAAVPGATDPQSVLDVLLHEIVHAVVGCDEGHKGQFIVVAKAVGLVRPWTSTTASSELVGKLKVIAEKLGPYPHSKLAVARKLKLVGKMRLYECGCEVPQKVRWGKKDEDLLATCKVCNEDFHFVAPKEK